MNRLPEVTGLETECVSGRAGTARPLRFGVMVPGPEISWWQAESIRRVIRAGVGTPELVIVDRTPLLARHRGRIHRETAWNLFQRMFVNGRVAASDRERWQPLMPNAEVIEVAAERRGRFSEYFAAIDVQKVRDRNLDFVLRFGFNIIRGEILRTPRFGVWSFHHGDLFQMRGQPACFWEVYRDHAVTGITLQRLTDALDAGVILGMRHIATIRKSYVRTRDAAFRTGVGMVQQVCEAILRGETAAVLGDAARTTAPIDRSPNWAEVLKFASKLMVRRATESGRWLFTHDQWNVGVVDATPAEVAAGRVSEPRWLPHPSRGEFLADPFAARVGDELVILAEHLAERENIGRLRAIRLDAAEAVKEISEPIEAPVHLSYPYLLRNGDRFLCVPETAQSCEVSVWESDNELRRWNRAGVILPGVAVIDPTLFRHEERWWLLGALRGDARTDELHAWHAATLGGPWQAHVGNPLKVDARSTRPAGTVFWADDQLHRPAQDCSRTYGGAIAINRIDELTPTRFRETTVARIACDPRWAYSRGTHTISQVDDRTFVIDAKRTRLSLQSFWRQIGARVTKRAGRAASDKSGFRPGSVSQS